MRGVTTNEDGSLTIAKGNPLYEFIIDCTTNLVFASNPVPRSGMLLVHERFTDRKENYPADMQDFLGLKIDKSVHGANYSIENLTIHPATGNLKLDSAINVGGYDDMVALAKALLKEIARKNPNYDWNGYFIDQL